MRCMRGKPALSAVEGLTAYDSPTEFESASCGLTPSTRFRSGETAYTIPDIFGNISSPANPQEQCSIRLLRPPICGGIYRKSAVSRPFLPSLFPFSPHIRENRGGIRKLPGLQLGVDFLPIQADFESAPCGRHKGESSDILLKLEEQFFRQTDGFWLKPSSGAIYDFDSHDWSDFALRNKRWSRGIAHNRRLDSWSGKAMCDTGHEMRDTGYGIRDAGC